MYYRSKEAQEESQTENAWLKQNCLLETRGDSCFMCREVTYRAYLTSWMGVSNQGACCSVRTRAAMTRRGGGDRLATVMA
jgi:hypothetical protein